MTDTTAPTFDLAHVSSFTDDPRNKPLAIAWGVLNSSGERPIDTSGAVDEKGMLAAYTAGMTSVMNGEIVLRRNTGGGVYERTPLSDDLLRQALEARLASLANANNGDVTQGLKALVAQPDVDQHDQVVATFLHEKDPDTFPPPIPPTDGVKIETLHDDVSAPATVGAPAPIEGEPVEIPDEHAEAFPEGTTVVQHEAGLIVANIPAPEGKVHHVWTALGEGIGRLAERVKQFVTHIL